MATVAELKAALKDALARSGALGQVRARVRAEVFAVLDDPGEPRPAVPRETLLLNELIREYLQFHRYSSSASVFLAESGQPEIPLGREFLANELNIVEEPSSRSVPLLYGILTQLLRGSEKTVPHMFPRAPSLSCSKWTVSKPSHQRSQTETVPESGHVAGVRLEDMWDSQGIHK
ncbi:centrosomal protein 20 [Candoia aspera]|uniref:centrosomal protein 20 n=1 Tax=Candoia aspera TaxID=51853 RepID=UPI002FD7DEBE